MAGKKQPHAGGSTPCGAKLRNGGDCSNAPMPNGRCRMHGGMTPSGIAHYNYKDGRYSKNIPPRMRERYAASLEDPELLSIRSDISLLDARLEDLLERVDRGESGELWQSLLGYVHAMKEAERKGETANKNSPAGQKVIEEAKWEREEAIRSIEITCQEGVADYAAWSDVRATLEQRGKASEREQNRLVKMQTMITAEQAVLLETRIQSIILRHVTDQHTLRALAAEFAAIAVAEPGGSPRPVPEAASLDASA